MTYAQLLSEYIEKSGLSLGEIAQRMNAKGISIDRSYISKLKNGQKPPASEEVSRALAEVTGGDPEKLVLAGYIEKAPKEIQTILRDYLDKLDFYTAVVATFFVDPDKSEDEQFKDALDIYKKIQNIDLEQKIDFVISRFNRVAISHPEFFQEVEEQWGLPKERIEEKFHAIKEKPLNRILVFDPIKGEAYYEWVATQKIRFGHYQYVIAPDDSMTGVNIRKGAKVLCYLPEIDAPRSKEGIDTGKIYAFFLNDELMIRRIFVQENGSIIFQAENPDYPPIVLADNDDFELVGLVKSAEFDPNAI